MAASPTNDPAEALDELAFHVLLLISNADDTIDAKEIEVFRRMLSNTRWCRSSIARNYFTRTDQAYQALWKKLTADGPSGNSAALRNILTAAQPTIDPDDRAALARDLHHLGHSIARASGGLLGLGTISRAEKRALDILDAICHETLLDGALADRDSSAAEPGEQVGHDWNSTPLWTKGRLEVRCVRVVAETHDVKTFRFVGTTPCRFSYKPGQFCTLELDIDGKKVLRSYTISSTPSRPNVLEITVKRVPGGLVSNWLHDHLREGDTAHIGGPAGTFSWLYQQPDRVLLLSGGSGITPVMSMARFLYDTGRDCDIVFLHSARTTDDLIFGHELELLAQRHQKFRLCWALTRTAPEGWTGLSGRLSADIIEAAAPDWMTRTVYLCGPNPFMAAAKSLLQSMGFPMDNYHAESFGGAPAKAPAGNPVLFDSLRGKFPTPPALRRNRPTPPALRSQRAVSDAPDQVVFAKSGQDAPCGDKTLLEAAESIGVDIANACRSGVCGTCKVAVLTGEVEMSCSDGLQPDEAAEGYVLTCVARARGRVEIDA